MEARSLRFAFEISKHLVQRRDAGGRHEAVPWLGLMMGSGRAAQVAPLRVRV